MIKLLAIQLPQWLIDTWGAYKDVIIPALITLAVALLTWLALKIKTDAKVNLGEMFDLVFQNSTLNQETKDSLTVLKNKMVFGVEDNLIKTLTEEKEKLEEKIAALEQVIAEATTIKEVKETRTRR